MQKKRKNVFINLKFKVILSSYDEKALKEASYSFILLSLFGGLGSRSRRGGGNFKINNISDTNYNQFLLTDIKKLDTIYQKIRKYFRDTYLINEIINKYSNLSNLDFKLSIRISKKEYNNWNQALKDIETEYKKFRKKKCFIWTTNYI